MSQKSLFAYFKSPKGKNTDEDNKVQGTNKDQTPKASPVTKQTKRASTKVSPSSKENKKPKRRRVILSDSEEESEREQESSGDEYQPDKTIEGSSDSDESSLPQQNGGSSGCSTPTLSAGEKRKRTPKTPTMSSTPKLSKYTATSCDTPSNASSGLSRKESPSVGRNTLSKLSSFSAPPEAGEADGVYTHQTLEFLKPDKIRDKEKRLRSDAEYDCRTLYIPGDFMKSTTPAMRQWWVLKVDHFDTVLFFKMGKFYEFFHMDADVGVKELGLVYMKGNYAHAGFPEIAYGRYADTLLRKGYKIARIEQTETPDMMSERLDQSSAKVTKFDKVVKREVCQITTPGTRTPNFLDGETIDVSSNYLLAVCELPGERSSQVGVCFLDTSTSRFHIGQFEDDLYGSRLRTLTAHYIPGQVLHEKRHNSSLLSHLFKTTLSSVMKEALVPGKEFWSSEQTIKFLSEADYFRSGSESQSNEWPEALKAMLDNSDAVCKKAKDGYDLAMRSLGAIVWYLRFSFLDQDILSLRLFTEYVPLDHQPADRPIDNSRMVMDSVTLANLDILVNQSTGTVEGTLLERLDKCKTAGGKRLLREWITAPLCDHRLINDRLEAVANLVAMGDLSPVQNEVMRKLPDFERLLSRIHMLGHAKKNRDHPDSRAIMFESDIYSKRKIDSFLSLVDGFKTALEVVNIFKSVHMTSNLLKKCVTFKQDGGHLADIRPLLKYFGEAFDHQAARKAGAIHPAKGYVEEYDESVEEIKSINERLTEYLRAQRKLLGSQQVVYAGTGRNRYQLEVPEAACKRVPGHYEVTGQKKGYKRYITKDIKSLLSEMMEAEEKQVLGLKDTMRKIFNKFDESYTQWMDVVQCMNVLDVLLSLATYTMTSEGIMCRPVLLPASSSTKPFIEIRDGRHPSAVKTFGGSDFIPNDTVIGCHDSMCGDEEKAELLLLTGPNMGGKSTLMRQVGLLTILAQVGCYVPADKCQLTAVDRIFTRLGASDRMMHGESTFFVELSETSAILKHATQHSLVLLDELGRGTATHDGTAIASAVVRQLAEHIQCRTIFSTHYHSLVEDFKCNHRVQLGHMACMVNDEGPAEGGESITFLYKLAPDFCPKSYGFNVARLAGLPSQVIELGLAKAQALEKVTESRGLLRSIMLAKQENRLEELRSLVEVL